MRLTNPLKLLNFVFTWLAAIASAILCWKLHIGNLFHDEGFLADPLVWMIKLSLAGKFWMWQGLFAFLEKRKCLHAHAVEVERTSSGQDVETTSRDDRGSVAIQVSAHEENEDYLRRCLQAIKMLQYPRSRLKVILTVDGNQDKNMYHWHVFEEVFGDEKAKLFMWDCNFHSLPEEAGMSNRVEELVALVLSSRCVCVMQKWGGKREVMYTAFKALGSTVDFIQVCDSDTILHPTSTHHLARVLESQPNVGAACGDVSVFNSGESFLAFLISIRYGMAFKRERACQSYFNCVQCMSGPISMYRNSVLQQCLDLWADQRFLGHQCTFGDDRHLTNRVLQLGLATKFTPLALCHTETPTTYLRWLSQQTRWTRSAFRELFFTVRWWHKHHIWMTVDTMFSHSSAWLTLYFMVTVAFSGDIVRMVRSLLIIEIFAVLPGMLHVWTTGDLWQICFIAYSTLWVFMLQPCFLWAAITPNAKGWGTSGRRFVSNNFQPLVPVSIWLFTLASGFYYSLNFEIASCLENGKLREENCQGYDLITHDILQVCAWSVIGALVPLAMFGSWRYCKQKQLLQASDRTGPIVVELCSPAGHTKHVAHQNGGNSTGESGGGGYSSSAKDAMLHPT